MAAVMNSVISNSVISALDTFTPLRTGENGSTEFDWSNDLEEKIVQFDFQCVRATTEGIQSLEKVLNNILSRLSVKHSSAKPHLEIERKRLLVILFKLIGKTRDIHGGKGEYALSYMMLYVWHKYYPELAKFALNVFVAPFAINSKEEEPYGSWKDIKYFCRYLLAKGESLDSPLITYCVSLVNSQLRADEVIYDSSDINISNKKLSLVAKWVAREGSKKFGQLYDIMAYDYFPHFIRSAKTDASRLNAQKKCKTKYRMLLSRLNRHLDTVQIKQTSGNWASIDHAKTTSITMTKQRRAFLNLPFKQANKLANKQGEETTSDVRSLNPDRIQCAENLRAYLESLKKSGKEVKGKHVGLEMFTEQAMYVMHSKEEADFLNSQWRDNCNTKNANGLGPMIAMVDTSGSMSGDPMNAAIALGCRVAEKSILGKRVLTFSAEPSWINLEGKETFTDMVSTIIKDSYAGLNTDFYKALDMILSAIEERRVPAGDVENMILAIFSDMQIDDNLSCMNGGSYNPKEGQKTAARGKWATMFQQIKQKYADVGMRMYGQPLTPPHILFWNLRKTNGFPTLSQLPAEEAGCSMMSGFDPTVLNMFCEMGLVALQEMTPFKTLMKLLDNPRYLALEMAIQSRLCNM
jgi:uncharacterized protein with von Willebrand factor type A (vWA) domain